MNETIYHLYDIPYRQDKNSKLLRKIIKINKLTGRRLVAVSEEINQVRRYKDPLNYIVETHHGRVTTLVFRGK